MAKDNPASKAEKRARRMTAERYFREFAAESWIVALVESRYKGVFMTADGWRDAIAKLKSRKIKEAV